MIEWLSGSDLIDMGYGDDSKSDCPHPWHIKGKKRIVVTGPCPQCGGPSWYDVELATVQPEREQK